MPASSTAKHPKGYIIDFFEDTHKYISIINNREITYTSGTQFIHPFFPPFDADGSIAKRCAEKEGISVEEIKAKWTASGKEATAFGTKVHECCEDIILGNELRNIATNDKEKTTFQHAIDISKKIKNRLDVLGVEKIVFSPQLRIAGTIDLFARSRKTGEYIIIDHKSNKSIDVENTWKKFALEPISHIPDTNFGHYSCQLNLYQYILKREGYVPKDAQFKMYLNHITELGAKLIEISNMQSEIKDMMIWHLANKQSV